MYSHEEVYYYLMDFDSRYKRNSFFTTYTWYRMYLQTKYSTYRGLSNVGNEVCTIPCIVHVKVHYMLVHVGTYTKVCVSLFRVH